MPTTQQILEQTPGLDYHKLHRWTTNRYIPTDTPDRPGSGHPRRYPDEALLVVHAMLRLTNLGLPPATAAPIARAAARWRPNDPATSHAIAPGVWVVVRPDLWGFGRTVPTTGLPSTGSASDGPAGTSTAIRTPGADGDATEATR